MLSETALEKLTAVELKAKLSRAWKKYQRAAERSMAPLLYFLRKKLKAQGKTGAGFGVWVEDNLDISRRTADRWADTWAISKGLKKPSSRGGQTFRQVSKSSKQTTDGKLVAKLSFVLTEREHEEFMAALQILGDKAERIIFQAVIDAAGSMKRPSASVPRERKNLTYVDSNIRDADQTNAAAKGAGK